MKTTSTYLRTTGRSFRLLAAILLFMGGSSLHAANFWQDVAGDGYEVAKKADHQRLLTLQVEALKLHLQDAAPEFSGSSTVQLDLPIPDGSFQTFEAFLSPIMEAPLAARYPGIRTYSIRSIAAPGISGRMDVTNAGFHAIIFTGDGTVYIDPAGANDPALTVSYYRRDYAPGDKMAHSSCTLEGAESETAKKIEAMVRKGVERPIGDELRTYRLAVAATGEYTTFHGGTVSDGLSAIVTTVNRVVGIYEREVAVRLILVADNDQIIYTNSNTDPFANNNTSTLINQSQSVIDNIIGSANYDVGHTFSTGAGGLASLGVICSNGNKARGVTGINAPVGDPFDVDYVAHELGHQFGAGHTFNGSSGSCGGNIGSNAYEPGSGSTIMAYAGICSPQNIQNFSDDYFHGISYDQITAYSILSNGNSCAAITPTGNSAPEVGVLQGGFTIPKSTPFELTGNATDPDGDVLTYQWEQFDLGPQGNPNNPSGNAPIFRSFLPTASPTRVFPRISDIVNNTQTLGEILPSYGRGLTFRFNARDNRAGGGGLDHDYISMTVDGVSGPFLVTTPNSAVTYEVNSEVTVEWDVAGTDAAPVNCSAVDIYLSTDGGFTYPFTLLRGTENDGSATVLIPNELTTTARIKVKAAGNVFFDISNTNFTIVEPTVPDFYLDVAVDALSICSPDDAVYTIDVEELAGFDDPVTLSVIDPPAGLTIDFSNNDFIPTQSTTLTVGNTGALSNGTYTLNLEVSGGAVVRNKSLSLEIFNAVPSAIGLTAPADEASAQALEQVFNWVPDDAATQYVFECATDAAFTDIIATYSGDDTNYSIPFLLSPSTTYFWRVRGSNTCGDGSYSEIYEFTTDALSCTVYDATDLPKIILPTGAQTVRSTINVPLPVAIADVNVLNLTGEHTYISDLDIYVTSPAGTRVDLLIGQCGDEQDFDINFDDAAGSSAIPCPPVDGGTYQPEGSLGDYYGEEGQGAWVLTIRDNFNLDGGVFLSWSLEVCQLASLTQTPPAAPTDLEATAVSASQIDLAWTDNATDETGYSVERSLEMNNGFVEIATVAANATSYSDGGLNSLTEYFYRVRALNNALNSAYSNTASDITFDVLAAPASGLVATATSTSTIDVVWTDNADNELGYIIERSVNDNGNYQVIDTALANATDYADEGLTDGTIYYYKVAAYNAIGNSAYSNEDSAMTEEIATAVIDQALDNSMVAYPNPTSGFVQLVVNQPGIGDLELSLFDAAGKAVVSQSYTKANRSFSTTLDMSELPVGQYVLKVRLNEGVAFRKIQKY